MHYLPACIAAAALLFGCSAAATAADRSHEFTVGANVDGAGSIVQIQHGPEMPASIVAVLQEALPHWRFVPVLRDGKPAVVHTFIRTRVEAIPAANGKFRVRVDYVGAGPMLLPGTPGPSYPIEAMRSHQDGLVLVSYDLVPDGGRVTVDAKRVGAKRNDPLTNAVRDWVARTRETPETVNGQPVAAHEVTYVRFTFGSPEARPPGLTSAAVIPETPLPLEPREKLLLESAGYTFEGDLEKTPLSASALKPSQTATVFLDP